MLFPEQGLAPNEWVLFAGETLSFLTGGQIQAPIHSVPFIDRHALGGVGLSRVGADGCAYNMNSHINDGVNSSIDRRGGDGDSSHKDSVNRTDCFHENCRANNVMDSSSSSSSIGCEMGNNVGNNSSLPPLRRSMPLFLRAHPDVILHPIRHRIETIQEGEQTPRQKVQTDGMEDEGEKGGDEKRDRDSENGELNHVEGKDEHITLKQDPSKELVEVERIQKVKVVTEGETEGETERDMDEDVEGDMEGKKGDMEGEIVGDMEGEIEGDLEGEKEGDLEGEIEGKMEGEIEGGMEGGAGQGTGEEGVDDIPEERELSAKEKRREIAVRGPDTVQQETEATYANETSTQQLCGMRDSDGSDGKEEFERQFSPSPHSDAPFSLSPFAVSSRVFTVTRLSGLRPWRFGRGSGDF